MNSATFVEEDQDLALAVGLYALGEFTLGEGADYADISKQRFLEILDKSSVKPRIGPIDISDAQKEVDQALDL